MLFRSDESEQSCLFRKFESLSCTWDTGDVDAQRFGWLSSLEDEWMYRQLCKLSEDDLELLTLLIVDGYRQADVARLWNCSRNVIYKRLKKIKNFLKQTGAQNAGRLDSFLKAQEMGIRLKKRWLATLDNRTRHTHRILDGQVRPNEKPFVVEGQEIMYPGDPSAAAALVYNCRCTLVAEVEGVDTSGALRRDQDGVVPNMTYEEWENRKRRGL